MRARVVSAGERANGSQRVLRLLSHSCAIERGSPIAAGATSRNFLVPRQGFRASFEKLGDASGNEEPFGVNGR